MGEGTPMEMGPDNAVPNLAAERAKRDKKHAEELIASSETLDVRPFIEGLEKKDSGEPDVKENVVVPFERKPKKERREKIS